jgi:hypothetical protein
MTGSECDRQSRKDSPPESPAESDDRGKRGFPAKEDPIRRSLLSLLVVTSVTVASVQAQQAAKQTPADEVIAITKAQWAAEMTAETSPS